MYVVCMYVCMHVTYDNKLASPNGVLDETLVFCFLGQYGILASFLAKVCCGAGAHDARVRAHDASLESCP